MIHEDDQDLGDYTPPDGSGVGLSFKAPADPPAGDAVALAFRYIWYRAPKGNAVGLDFSGAYTPPLGSEVRLNFSNGGDDSGPKPEQFLFPEGWASWLLGEHSVSNWTQRARPAGWDGLAWGQHAIANKARLLRATGWGSQAFGGALVRNKSQGIFAPSIQAGAVWGQAWASLWIRTLQARGWQSDQHGQARIYNLKQTIGQAGAIASRLAFGQAQAYNRDRTVNATSVFGQLFGTATLSHKERRIEAPSILMPGFGTAWLSFALRAVAPAGIYGTVTGLAKVGGTRYLRPEGFDAARYGARIIPESQSVFPQGWREQWGDANVRNARHVVQPPGFMPNDSESARFGFVYAYNLRQYLHTFHSEASQAMGEVWGQWTSIANRNRSVGAIGFNASILPRQYVENKARAVLPLGLDASGYGQAFVAPAVRFVRPDAIDAPYIGQWGAVLNTARLLRPLSWRSDAWGVAAVRNTRRFMERIGNWDSQAFGAAFVAFARREIRFEPRYAIQPPAIPLPVVDNLTKYIDAATVGDQSRYGLAYLEIHWSKLYPRMGDLARYGIPTLRKLTPELLAQGRNHEEHGLATIQLHTRYLAPAGIAEGIPGRPLVRDRRSWVYPGTRDMSVVSTQAVIQNLQPDPPLTRWLMQGGGSANDQLRMGKPDLNQQVIYPESHLPATLFGEPTVLQNVVQPVGIYDFFATGTPFVSLRNRKLTVVGIESSMSFGKPRLNPHTIWATRDVTNQAVENHGRLIFYPVDYPPEGALKGVGTPSVGLRYRRITGAGGTAYSGFGTPDLSLRRRYIRPAGWKLSKVGWHEIPQFIRYVRQYASPRFDVFGMAEIAPAPYTGPQTIRPVGMEGVFGQTRIEHFHRQLSLAGWNSMAMGFSSGGPRYMRQSLWVGEPDWPQMQGFDAALYGKQWISLKVREVKPEAWDSFICDYDLDNFDQRMRVRRSHEEGPASNSVSPFGWASQRLGLPEAKHLQHFIRPDGNSEHFRNGAPTWLS
ncbi:hypothetical protein LZ683_08955 [Comamonas testosteroni]|uniref:hypothetical protein n=1 Tax=Comamonas testosteroni TaxID=285 RepID=UPI0023AADA31|nr:hypothetical protein [Comamonas testosteroni]WEE79470.1 hypothetical protein LZ683_08955 [Comamonas testosteroni]